jgi:8-oxo-dGTP pyrophosphatase MutT (NUDIX family)
MPDLDAIRRALAKPGRASSDFDLHPDLALPADRVLKPAGVLIALQDRGAGLEVILTKRAAHLKNHPGQIAFAGGRQDADDADAVAAALREAEEEIGLPRALVEVIGALPPHETVTNYQVTPVVGLVTAPFEEIPEQGEVAEVFRVPLAHVTNRSNFQVEGRRWQGRCREYYVVPYGPYYIWGATARILLSLAERMQK